MRAALADAGIDPDDNELSIAGTDSRWSWHLLGRSRVDDRIYDTAFGDQIVTCQRWRSQQGAPAVSSRCSTISHP